MHTTVWNAHARTAVLSNAQMRLTAGEMCVIGDGDGEGREGSKGSGNQKRKRRAVSMGWEATPATDTLYGHPGPVSRLIIYPSQLTIGWTTRQEMMQ